jgi:hypothetical protein
MLVAANTAIHLLKARNGAVYPFSTPNVADSTVSRIDRTPDMIANKKD